MLTESAHNSRLKATTSCRSGHNFNLLFTTFVLCNHPFGRSTVAGEMRGNHLSTMRHRDNETREWHTTANAGGKYRTPTSRSNDVLYERCMLTVAAAAAAAARGAPAYIECTRRHWAKRPVALPADASLIPPTFANPTCNTTWFSAVHSTWRAQRRPLGRPRYRDFDAEKTVFRMRTSRSGLLPWTPRCLGLLLSSARSLYQYIVGKCCQRPTGRRQCLVAILAGSGTGHRARFCLRQNSSRCTLFFIVRAATSRHKLRQHTIITSHDQMQTKNWTYLRFRRREKS